VSIKAIANYNRIPCRIHWWYRPNPYLLLSSVIKSTANPWLRLSCSLWSVPLLCRGFLVIFVLWSYKCLWISDFTSLSYCVPSYFPAVSRLSPTASNLPSAAHVALLRWESFHGNAHRGRIATGLVIYTLDP